MKDAPVGVVVLKPTSEDMMSYYLAHAAEYERLSDGLNKPRFSQSCLDDLHGLLKDKESVELIQALVRLKNYADKDDHESMQKAVAKLLKKKGVRQSRGKRTRPGTANLVSDIAPVLLYYGLPCATGDNSPLVKALRIISEEIGLDGDPRNEVKRLKRMDKKHADYYYTLILRTAIEAVRPDIEEPQVNGGAAQEFGGTTRVTTAATDVFGISNADKFTEDAGTMERSDVLLNTALPLDNGIAAIVRDLTATKTHKKKLCS